MRFTRYLRHFCLLVPLVVIPGCATNPVTGEKELSLVSSEQELAIGEKNYGPSLQAQGGEYSIDPQLGEYVSRVGQRLAAVSDTPDLPYEFEVLNNPVPNAWAMPGGKIAINTGLLVELENEAQLAAVLAHEIVHAAARHGASQMSRGMLLNVGTLVANIASREAGYGALGGTVAQLGSAAWMARYGREDELEADAYGMEYMAAAGYDPRAAVELQETFVRLNENRRQDFISGLFASHPPSQERVARNREKAAELGAGGERNRDTYQRRIAQLEEDWPAYEAQQEARKALEQENPRRALELLDKAVSIQPADGHFWELRGHAWRQLEDSDKALEAFGTAVDRNPDYFSHYLARGVTLYEQGRRRQARPDLEKSYDLLPTDTASYYLGELAQTSGNTDKALGYYQQAAQSDTRLGSRAREEMVRLDLDRAPHKYIPARTYIGDNGYLHVLIQNQSGLTVENVQLQLTQMQSAYTASGSRRMRGPSRLDPGQRWSTGTGIGPFQNREAASRFRVQVTGARVR